ncbi:MAG: hypothetical protein R2912_05940 [Eubacteriales bacterium]
MALKTGNLLFLVPAALVILLDGGIELFKLLFIRLTKIKGFLKAVRTPLHDHARFKWSWSDTQVGYPLRDHPDHRQRPNHAALLLQ